MFFGKGLTSKMTSLKKSFDSPTSEPSQQTIETFTANTQTMKAEIIWALKTVVSGLSDNWSNDISNCFHVTCPNNATAEQFSLGRTKSTYVVNHGLSTYFSELLTENVNLSDCLALLFDKVLTVLHSHVKWINGYYHSLLGYSSKNCMSSLLGFGVSGSHC